MSNDYYGGTTLFSDHTLAVGQAAFLDEDDEYTPAGAHWCVSLNADMLPAAPLLLFESYRANNEIAVTISGRVDGVFPEVRPDRPLLIGIHNDAPMQSLVAWVQVMVDGDVRVSAIDPTRAAPNGEYLEIAAREREPYFLAVADLRVLRVTGSGTVSDVVVYGCPAYLSDSLTPGDLVDSTTLPAEIVNDLPDYQQAAIVTDSWQNRVQRSAPLRGLPYDPVSHDVVFGSAAECFDAEAERIEHLAARGVAPWTIDSYAALRDFRAADMFADVVSFTAPAALHTACTDPGVARWLGLSGTAPDVAIDHAQMYAALLPVFRPTGAGAAAWGGSLLTPLYDSLTDDAYSRAVDAAANLPGWSPQAPSGWEVRLLAVPVPAAPVPPAVPPTPSPHPRIPMWRTGSSSPWSWDQRVALVGSVPTGRVSLVATSPYWQSLHTVDEDGHPNTLIAGWSDAPGEPREPVVCATALTVDDDPPDETLEIGVRLGDWAGRWSDTGTATLVPPPRPVPPAPEVVVTFYRGPVPTSSAARSPGTIRVQILVPRRRNSGALDVDRVSLSGGISQDVALTTVDPERDCWVQTVDTTAPKTTPGQQFTVTVVARSVDTAGAVSDPVQRAVQVSDGRAIAAPTIAPRLAVTTRRTNAPTVSVTLAVRPPAGVDPSVASYRFLMAAERTLRANAGLGQLTDAQPRAQRAKALVDSGGERRHYMWAIDQPVRVGADGLAHATITLPSGTDDVTLIKAVPMVGPSLPGGDPVESVSTPFTSIRAVPVVVPAHDVPPIPRISVRVDGGSVLVDIRVAGVDTVALGRLTGPVQARIVEVADPRLDARYWPEVAVVDLEPADGEFVGRMTIDDAPPWVRIAVSACARYPAERTLLKGSKVANPELKAEGVQPDFIESPWGACAPPEWAWVPGDEPTLADASTPAALVAAVTGVPEIPAGQPLWSAEVLSGAGAVVPQNPPHKVPLESGASTIQLGARTAGTGYAFRLVDPFGCARTPVKVEG